MHSLSELRNLILTANDLSVPLNYFFDLIDKKVLQDANHRRVRQLKKFNELLDVVKAIEVALGQILEKKVQVASQDFYQVAYNNFYHGICTFKDIPFPLTIVYFSDVQTGLFSMTNFGHKAEIFRFFLSKESSQSLH